MYPRVGVPFSIASGQYYIKTAYFTDSLKYREGDDQKGAKKSMRLLLIEDRKGGYDIVERTLSDTILGRLFPAKLQTLGKQPSLESAVAFANDYMTAQMRERKGRIEWNGIPTLSHYDLKHISEAETGAKAGSKPSPAPEI